MLMSGRTARSLRILALYSSTVWPRFIKRQDAVGAALHRQVQMADQLRHAAVDLDQPVGKFHRVGGGVADAVNALMVATMFDQQRQIGGFAVMLQAAIGVDVLTEQIDFAHPLRRQRRDLGQTSSKGRLTSSPRV
jgi:hypothetical protein